MTQATLPGTPTAKLLTESRLVPIDQIEEPTFFRTLGGLVESIKKYGVWTPILVRPLGDRFRVVAGRRRYWAAIEAGLDEIPALVIKTPIGEYNETFVALAENAVRSSNLRFEVKAIETLVDSGLSVREIAAESGLKVAEVKQRLTLLDLTPSLMDRYMDGEIADGVALKAAKLKQPQQMWLVEQAEAGATITERLVKEARSAMVQRTVAQVKLPGLPADLTEIVPDAAFGDIYGDEDSAPPMVEVQPAVRRDMPVEEFLDYALTDAQLRDAVVKRMGQYLGIDDLRLTSDCFTGEPGTYSLVLQQALREQQERDLKVQADQLQSVQVGECANCATRGLVYFDREAWVHTDPRLCGLAGQTLIKGLETNGTDGADTSESGLEAREAAVMVEAESSTISGRYELLEAAVKHSLRILRRVDGKANKPALLNTISEAIGVLGASVGD